MASAADDDFPLLAYLDGLMEDLQKNVPRALRDFDADGIHDARVATRRLKAAMGLLEPVLSDDHRKPLEKVLKKLRRRLGPLRDLDVMIGHLAELSAHASHAAAATWLGNHLTAQRDREREQARKKTAPADVLSKLGTWWAVRHEILEARDAIDTLLSQSLHLQLDAFAEQAAQLRSDSPGRRNDPHQLRIAGKLLRYTLELAKAQGHKLPSAVLKSFKKMQESLGTWHDDVVIVGCVMSTSLDQALAYHDPKTQESLLKLSQLFLARSQRELANFSKLWEKRGDEVAQTIRDRFPLTRPAATAPQTDPGPLDSGDTPAPAAPAPDVASTA